MLAFILSLFTAFSPSSNDGSTGFLGYSDFISPDSSAISEIDSAANRYIRIGRVFILGNHRTKESIINRELSVKSGEIYYFPDLQHILDLDKQKVFNTQLFNKVEISLLEIGRDLVDIVVQVDERWYLFPIPIFEIVDRNFNDWIQNHGADLSRVNYGLKLYQKNVRGRNETLRLTAQLGFTRTFDIDYTFPYLDKAQRHGLNLKLRYSEFKNLPYRTIDHDRDFIEAERVVQVTREASVRYTNRKSFYGFHSVNFGYQDSEVDDTVKILNPNFFLDERNQQQMFYLGYHYRLDKRDVIAYPLRGYRFDAFFTKLGLGIFNDINQFNIRLRFAKYWDVGKGFYLSNFSSMYTSGPVTQPYAGLRGLGYGQEFVRGYELYVIEGQSFLLNRTTFKKRIISVVKTLKDVPIRQFRHFPLDIYLKTYFDAGYVDNFELYEETNQNNRLSNTPLAGTGAGVDIVTLYDMVFRFEYSINAEQETGFFFHIKKEF